MKPGTIRQYKNHHKRNAQIFLSHKKLDREHESDYKIFTNVSHSFVTFLKILIQKAQNLSNPKRVLTLELCIWSVRYTFENEIYSYLFIPIAVSFFFPHGHTHIFRIIVRFSFSKQYLLSIFRASNANRTQGDSINNSRRTDGQVNFPV